MGKSIRWPGKPYAVKAYLSDGAYWYYFSDFVTVVRFMLHVEKSCHKAIGCRKNELGQYEPICWTDGDGLKDASCMEGRNNDR